MRIWVSRYELEPRAALNSRVALRSRQGALLRTETEYGFGYADCHPWEEFGDTSLDNQLELLKNGFVTALTGRSLEFARADAHARAQRKSLFEGLEIPESHALVTDLMDLDAKEGFRSIKVKMGRDPAAEAKRLRALVAESDSLLRLDFNATLSRETLDRFLENLGEGIKRIEFLEDPMPWNEKDWATIRERWGVALAADRETEAAEWVDFRVIKPAVQERIPASGRIVFTSYLDHPLGQVSAAWVAASFSKTSGDRLACCGLLSQVAYQPNAFSERLKTKGARLSAPEGTGFGFDDLLLNLEWRELG